MNTKVILGIVAVVLTAGSLIYANSSKSEDCCSKDLKCCKENATCCEK